MALRPVSVLLSVTSISSHIFKARGLKFGMHNHHINGSKSAEQNFDILSRTEIF